IEYTENVEQPPEDEVEDIAKTLAILHKLLHRQLKRSGEARRDVHVKAHGCATGKFQVKQGLPAELAQGLFAQPRVYSALVRFSNSAPWPQPDAIPDGRGLAFQVENDLTPQMIDGVNGRTEDFVMVNHATFIARDVK